MKKYFLSLATAVTLVACSGKGEINIQQEDSLNVVVETIKNEIPEEVMTAMQTDEELLTLVEKAQTDELSGEEKLTLWKKLQKAGVQIKK